MKSYKNKRFSILGDSISTLLGYNPEGAAVFYDAYMGRIAGVLAPEDTWWGQVINALGGELLVNDSFSGSTVCPLHGGEIESHASGDKRTSNLARDGVSPDVILIMMGTNDCGMRFSLDGEFIPSYRLMLEKIKSLYPLAEIYCITPLKESAYADAVRELALEYGCRLADLAALGLCCETVDGLHPSADGIKKIADAVLSVWQ